MGDKKFVMPETKNYAFTQHKKCEWFPCHKGIPEEDFNCLFVFVPSMLWEQSVAGITAMITKRALRTAPIVSVPITGIHTTTS